MHLSIKVRVNIVLRAEVGFTMAAIIRLQMHIFNIVADIRGSFIQGNFHAFSVSRVSICTLYAKTNEWSAELRLQR